MKSSTKNWEFNDCLCITSGFRRLWPLLALGLAFTLVACGGTLKQVNPNGEKEGKSEKNSKIVAAAKDAVFGGIEAMAVNGDGQFVISWSPPLSAPEVYRFLIYVQTMDKDPTTGTYVDTYKFRPVTKGTIPYKDSPTKWGIRVEALPADVLSYTFPEDFDPDKAYGIQVKLEDQEHRLDYNESLIMVKMDEVFAEDYYGCVSAEALSSTAILLTYVYPDGAEKVEIMRREEVPEAPETPTIGGVIAEAQAEIDSEVAKAEADAENILNEGEVTNKDDPDEGFKVVTEFIGLNPSETTQFTDTGEEGKKYKYRCRFHRLNFTKDGLNEPTVQTPNVAPVPGGEGVLTLATLPSTDIQVSWTLATDNVTPQEELEYVIYLSVQDDIGTVEDAIKNGAKVGTVTNQNSFQVGDLDANAFYFFNVIVADKAGNKAAYQSGRKMAYEYPKITFQDSAQTQVESDGTVSLVVLVEHMIDVPIVQPYSYEFVSGTENSDFSLSNAGTITIAAGATSAALPIQIIDDGLNEGVNEQVKFTLATPANDGQLGNQVATVLTITDNDEDVGVTIDQMGSQTDPTNALPVLFEVSFDRVIDPNSFTVEDIVQNGSAAGITWTLTSDDNIAFVLSATAITEDGTLEPFLAASSLVDTHGNPNLDSTSTDSEVTYDSTPPTVDAGVDHYANAPTLLMASATDAGAMTYLWEKTAGGDAFSFDDATLLRPTFTATATDVYTLRLTVTDAAGNSASDTLNFDWDQTGGTVTIDPPEAGEFINLASASSYTVSGTCSEEGQAIDFSGPATGTATCSNGQWSVALDFSGAPDGTVTLQADHEDTLGNNGQDTQDFSKDVVPPDVTIEQAAGQGDPTKDLPVSFTFTFNEPIDPDSFTDADITQKVQAGGAVSVNFTIVSNVADTTFTVDADIVGVEGTILPRMLAGAVTDPAGNPSNAPTSADGSVEYETTAPTVDAGSDFSANAAAQISDASATDEFGVADYLWEQISGPGGGTVSFDDATVLNPIVSADVSGAYSLQLTVTDNAGNTASDTMIFTWDQTPATVTIDTPAPGEYINLASATAHTVSGTCSEEGRAVDLSGAATGTATCNSGIWSVDLNFSGASDGTVTLQADHEDALGNGGQDTQDFEKDVVPPDVTIEQAALQGDPVKDLPISFTFTFTEPIDPNSFTDEDITQKVQAGGAVSVNFSIVNNDSDTTFTVDADIVGVAGTVLPKMMAGMVTDLAGNPNNTPTSSDASVEYDITLPTVEAGSDVSANGGVQLTDTAASDAHGVATLLWEQISGPGGGSVTFDNTAIINPTVSANMNGSYGLRLTVTDNAGNQATDTMTFTWDTDPATVTIESPAAASFVNAANQGNFAVTGSCSENNQNVVISGDASATVICLNDSWTANLNFSAAAAGDVTINVDHADSIGNAAVTASRTFNKDIAVDTGASALITPADSSSGPDAAYDDDINIFFKWTAGADSNGIAHYIVTYYYNGTCSGGGNNTAHLTNTFYGQVVSDGDILSFKVTTTDNAGNTNVSGCSTSIEIVYNPPVVTAVASPNPGSISVSGSVTSSDIDVTCDLAGQARISNNADNAVILDWSTVTAATPTTLNITGGELQSAVTNDGTYTLKIECRNLAGTISTTANSSHTLRLDDTDPLQFATFSVDTGSGSDGDIDLSWTDTGGASTDYEAVTIRRLAGGSAPADCNSGVIVYSVPDPYAVTSYTDATGSTTGETFSYRACFYDAVGNETLGNQAQGIQARDTQDPMALDNFTGVAGANHGELDLTIDYPVDTSDYDRLEIRWLAGSTAPSAACTNGDGSAVITTITNFATTAYTHDLGIDTGAAQSYRSCIYDSSANLTATSPTVVGATPLDTVAPSQLDAFSYAGAGATGELSLTVDFPAVVSDYHQVVLRRVPGGSAPTDCVDGDPAKTYNTGEFIDETLSDSGLTAGGTYSYRVCISDTTGNTTSSQTVTGVLAGS